MNISAMNFVSALCAEQIPKRCRLAASLRRTTELLTEAPSKSSSCWCRAMFLSLLDVLQNTFVYGRQGAACNAIIFEVRDVEWYEPTESYDYQSELKLYREALQNVFDARGNSRTFTGAVSNLPALAAMLAYRIYVMEQGFISDMEAVI